MKPGFVVCEDVVPPSGNAGITLADNLVAAITAPSVESLADTYDVTKNPTSEIRDGVMAPCSWSTGPQGNGFDAQNRLTNWTRTNSKNDGSNTMIPSASPICRPTCRVNSTKCRRCAASVNAVTKLAQCVRLGS